MKKIVLLLVTSIIFTLFVNPVFANETEVPKLSEMSDEEIFSFLEDNSIEIPVGLGETSEQLALIVRDWIAQAELNPRIYFPYGIASTEIFANEIVAAVNKYYGIDLEALPQTYASHNLKDSTVYSTANMSMYNCYAYAIHATGAPRHPGQYITGQALTSTDVKNMSLYDLVELALLDLEDFFEYDCINVTQSLPTSLKSGQRAFCIRRGHNANGVYDYHCMRFTGSEWRHKPGLTALLTYDYYPTEYRDWTNEGYNGWIVVGGDVVYSGTIYFIIYQYGHDYERGTPI